MYKSLMIRRILLALIFVAPLMFPGVALADACDARARAELARHTGAELLSVKSVKDAQGKLVCKVRIKLASKDGKPGRVLMRTLRP